MIRSPDIDKIVAKKPRIRQNLTDGMVEYVSEEGKIFFKYAKAEAPYKSGRLKESMELTIDKSSVDIDTKVSYADAVYGGSRAHTIYTKKAEALYFNGRFSKSADIPAIKANPYLDKSWARHEKEFVDGIETGAVKVIEEKVL